MLLQFIQSGSGFGLFFPLIIHIQMGKLHFGSHGKNEESKRNPFDMVKMRRVKETLLI